MNVFNKALIVVLLACLPTVAEAQVTVTQVWTEFPWVSPSTTAAATLKLRLQAEVQRVLNTGQNLLPCQQFHGDVPTLDFYWTDLDPGRMVEAMAWAYPYLTTAQKTAVTGWVTNELGSTNFAPWSSQLSPTTAGGTRREMFPMTRVQYTTTMSIPTTMPLLHTLYGLWLWGWRTGGNWSLITTYQTQIRSIYTSRSSQGNIYGTMSGHIAKARLEQLWGNTTNRDAAIALLSTAMTDGTTFTTMDTRAQAYWAYQYADSRKSGSQYLGWMFLHTSPEIARYISSAGQNITAALARHAAGKAAYPLWWLREAPYSNGQTGFVQPANTEASGMSDELFEMIEPLEMYALNVGATTMDRYLRSAPGCIGDPAWIAGAAHAIEATGTRTWVDVRNGYPE